MTHHRATLGLVVGLVLAVVPACGQQVAGEPRPANLVSTGTKSATPTKSSRPGTTSRRPTSTSSAPAGLVTLVGTWEGEYTCAQGATGLKLIIKAPDGDSLPTVFEFFPLPENPQAKAGSYAMRGSVSGGKLTFRQEQWIDQPPGYVMVDLQVTSPVEEDTTQLSGDVLTDSCKGFSVRRR